MPSVKQKFIPLMLGVAIAAGVFIGGKLNFSDTSDRLFSTNSKKDKLNRLIDYIDYEYVDKIDTDSIVDVTVNGILENLDPHSTYISKKDLKRVTENMKGDFVGIGVNFYPYRDSIAVIRPTEGGPSARAGIKGGDRIVMADGQNLVDRSMNSDSLVTFLKGEIDSKVRLKVFRRGESELLEFEIKRTHIPIKSVESAYMLNSKLGYIKINRFAESTFKEFKSALTRLQRKGATQLALDLRDNPGGFLGIAEQIADEFLSGGKLILFTKNKKGKIERTFATSRGDFEAGEVFVLQNENSASASEVISGALQDNDKGLIIGRRSYGKGLVQREMALGDGSAVRLTVSRYFTPTGRSIQRPYSNGENRAYYRDYLKRLRTGELSNENSIEVADSLKFTTPKGKVVYGGGGIIPDVFVPLDSQMENETINYLNRVGHFGFFVFELLDKDRSLYTSISKRDFIDNFTVSDDIVLRFQDFVNRRERTAISFAAYDEAIKVFVKANLARQLYDDNAYFEVINRRDLMIEEVILLSQNSNQF